MNDPSLSPLPYTLAVNFAGAAKRTEARGAATVAIDLTPDALRVCAAALRAVRGVPEGWRLVPVCGTEDMVSAWCNAGLSYRGQRQTQGEVRAMFLHSLTAAIAAAPVPPLWPDAGSDRVRHLKRGSAYTVACRTGELQASRPIHEGDMLATYIGADGKVWHRPIDEFEDGRFEAIPAEAQSEPATIGLGLTIPALRLLLAMIKREGKETIAMIGTDAAPAEIDARAIALDELTRAILPEALARAAAAS